VTESPQQPTSNLAPADTRPRGVKGWLIIPALLQPAWAILWHLRDGLEVALKFHPERDEREQLAILFMVLVLGALTFGWAGAIWQAFRHAAIFPRLYLWMVLAELASIPAMITAILIYPFMAFGGLMLFAGLHGVLGLIFASYMKYSKRVRTTFGGGL
jgi:hypothetical protein